MQLSNGTIDHILAGRDRKTTDLTLKLTTNRFATSIRYKPTDTCSYQNYASSHPTRCKEAILYSQFLHLRYSCSDETAWFWTKEPRNGRFFRRLGYPQRIINPANVRVLATPRWALISEPGGTPAEQAIIPLVMTYRPTNILVKNIIRKLAPATRYPNTAAIFQLLRILCAYRCDTNLHYSLVGSALDNTTSTYNYRGTFSCGRTRCNTCLHTNASAFIA